MAQFGTSQFDLLTARPMDDDFLVNPRTRNTQTQDDDEDVALSETLYEKFEQESRSWRKERRTDLQYYYGASRSQRNIDAMERLGLDPVSVDLISPAVEQAVAMLTSNHPQFSATGKEDSDTKLGRVVAMMMGHTWHRSDGNARLKIIAKNYYVQSIGWGCVYYDGDANNGNGEILFTQLDPDTVFYDASVADDLFFANSPHMIIRTLVSAEEVAAEHAEWQDYLPEMSTARDSKAKDFDRVGIAGQHLQVQTTTEYYERLDRYSRIQSKHYMFRDRASGFEKAVRAITDPQELSALRKNKFQTPRESYLALSAFYVQDIKGTKRAVVKPTDFMTVATLFADYGPIVHMVQDQEGRSQFIPGDERVTPPPQGYQVVPGSTLNIYPCRNAKLVEMGLLEEKAVYLKRIQRVLSIGGVKLYRDILPTEHYPLVPLINGFDGNPFPISDVSRVRGLQEYVNNMQNLIVAHAYMTTNYKIQYPLGGHDEHDLTAALVDPMRIAIPYDTEAGPLVPLAPAPLPNELYKAVADARSDVERILGIYALMQGSPNDAPSTYKGTVALDEYGQRRIKSKKDDIEAFVNQIGRVVIDYMQHYYDHYRIERLIQPNGKRLVVALNANKVNYEDLTEEIQEVVGDITVGRYDVQVVSGSMLPSNRWALAEYYRQLYVDGIIDREEMLKKTDVADVEGLLQRTSEINQLKGMVAQLSEQVGMLRGDLQTSQRMTMNALKTAELEKFKADVDRQKVRVETAAEVFGQRLGDELSNTRAVLNAHRKLQEAKQRIPAN